METIRFAKVTPKVFASRDNSASELWDKDVSLRRGVSYLVEAASGQGKSTFCSYVLGYRNDYDGMVAFDDDDTRRYTVAQWVDVRRNHIACLFQELRLFPELTAMENVQVKNNLTHHLPEATVKEWFGRLGLEDKTDALVGKMSFGQQQRVAMMRALAQPFDFILADEPISHLDDDNAHTMAEIMVDEARRQGAGIIVTSIGKRLPMEYDTTIRL